MTQVRYMTAAEWGIRWANGGPIGESKPDPEVYVHHTAGTTSRDAVNDFRALNEFSINSKNMRAVGYDVLVHYDIAGDLLTIGEGRGPYMSAATLDRNEVGEAVCVLGYFHPGHALSRVPHAAEVEGVALGIAWGVENGWIKRDPTVYGHRDNPSHPGATPCPGDYLYPFLPQIRARMGELLNEKPINNPPLADAVEALAVVMTYCACNPGGHSQTALWDIILKHMADGATIPAGSQLRTDYEYFSRYPGGGNLDRTWDEIKAVLGLP